MRTDCRRHLMEPAVDVCGGCVETYCRECLVYPFGAGGSPYCLACAVTAAGLRRTGAPPPRRSRRRQQALVAERRARLVADSSSATARRDDGGAGRRAG